jgi:hypothetical protein
MEDTNPSVDILLQGYFLPRPGPQGTVFVDNIRAGNAGKNQVTESLDAKFNAAR